MFESSIAHQTKAQATSLVFCSFHTLPHISFPPIIATAFCLLYIIYSIPLMATMVDIYIRLC